MTSSAWSGHREGEELHVGMGLADPVHDRDTATIGHVDVDQHHGRARDARISSMAVSTS